jgi:AraC family transcriptional regulator
MEAPRIEDRESFLLAGSVGHYRMPGSGGIPRQWQEFAKQLGKIPGQVGWTTYGVCFNMDGNGKLDYLCGVEVAEGSPTPAGLSLLKIKPQLYAVFRHSGHISKIQETWGAIFHEWAPSAGKKMAAAPQFEVYDDRFDPQSGNGVVEIWIPVER